MAKKQKYLKMGEKASGFADPSTLVHLSGKEVIKVSTTELKAPKVKKALLGGHLVIADEEEYEAWVKFEASTRKGPKASATVVNAEMKKENEALKDRIAELEAELEAKQKPEEKTDDPKPLFKNMNGKALVKYYKANYEVSEEEVETFEDLELEKKRETLETLENENE